jgi:1-deoxy-D-xylulose-5-phosphate reductoisomerase
MPDVRRVIVLGSTGSIGTQTLEVIAHLNAMHERGRWSTRYEVVGLAAGSNTDLLAAQAARFGVRRTCHVQRQPSDGPARGGTLTVTPVGCEAEELVRLTECDVVVAAISGMAGLAATLAAVELGRTVALANKETLVAAGALVTGAARRCGARLLPVDSEHSGLWQCLGIAAPPPLSIGPEVAHVMLTASGGPFRTWPASKMATATVADALKHPTWSMGRKVTIDSATLMNKALEVIEAHWLFGLGADRIRVLIHPQSIVHASVHFVDGSSVSQMGAPDMRTPIQLALTWPRRAAGCAASLNPSATLEFEEPDTERFPALGLAYRALADGGAAGATLNAANEVAVDAFLSGRVPFTRIAELVRFAMDSSAPCPADSLPDILAADQAARRLVREKL